jgi:cell division protein FtsI/penicillin-binding protein 2
MVSTLMLAAALGVVCVPDAVRAGSRRITTEAITDNSLSGRTAAQVLSHEFSSSDISYLLLDIPSRSILAKHWQNSDGAIPAGSLVKPFTALAYAESHSFRFPEFVCTPGACWYPQGHGKLGIVGAVGFSCNAYFINLAANVSAAQVTGVANRFGLNGPGSGAGPDVMAGRYGVWRESPEALARAYAELLGSGAQPGIRELVEGMAVSAKSGTALGLAREAPQVAALAKTGTSSCTHQQHLPGDGFVIVAWPADSPQHLLLVGYHGKPGAYAATVAGKMLHALQP